MMYVRYIINTRYSVSVKFVKTSNSKVQEILRIKSCNCLITMYFYLSVCIMCFYMVFNVQFKPRCTYFIKYITTFFVGVLKYKCPLTSLHRFQYYTDVVNFNYNAVNKLIEATSSILLTAVVLHVNLIVVIIAALIMSYLTISIVLLSSLRNIMVSNNDLGEVVW